MNHLPISISPQKNVTERVISSQFVAAVRIVLKLQNSKHVQYSVLQPLIYIFFVAVLTMYFKNNLPFHVPPITSSLLSFSHTRHCVGPMYRITLASIYIQLHPKELGWSPWWKVCSDRVGFKLLQSMYTEYHAGLTLTHGEKSDKSAQILAQKLFLQMESIHRNKVPSLSET